MDQQLKEKLQQVIEDNFAKSESEVLTRLVAEHGALKAANENLEAKIKSLKEDLNEKRASVEEQAKFIQKLNSQLEAETKAKVTAIADHDKMKKEIVELEVKYLKESKSEIFKLAETAFRHPTTIREFDLPIKTDSYTSQWNSHTSRNEYAKAGEYVDRYKGQELTREE